jgi:hypothetical protein
MRTILWLAAVSFTMALGACASAGGFGGGHTLVVRNVGSDRVFNFRVQYDGIQVVNRGVLPPGASDRNVYEVALPKRLEIGWNDQHGERINHVVPIAEWNFPSDSYLVLEYQGGNRLVVKTGKRSQGTAAAHAVWRSSP